MRPLSELISADGGLSRVDAVGWALRLARLAEPMHARGTALGTICAENLCVEASDAWARGELVAAAPAVNAAYRCPERYGVAGPSAADDVWAISVFTFLALTGALPFEGKTEEEIRERIRSGDAPPLSRFGVQDPRLERVMEAALRRDRSRRILRLPLLRRALEVAVGDARLSSLPPLAFTASQPPAPGEGEDDEADDDEARTVMREIPADLLASMSERNPLAVSVEAGAVEPAAEAAPPEGEADESGVLAAGTPSPAANVAAEPEPRAAPPADDEPPSASPSHEAPQRPAPRAQAPRGRGTSSVLVAAAVGLIALGGPLAAMKLGYLSPPAWLASPPSLPPAAVAPDPAPPAPPSAAGEAVAPSPDAPAPATAAPEVSAPEVSAPEVVAPAKSPASVTVDEVLACAERTFPPLSLLSSRAKQLAQICDEPDPRRATKTLRREIVLGGANRGVTEAMREWEALGWYQLAAVAIVRGQCCGSSAAAIEMPAPPESCASLGAALNDLAARTVAAKSFEDEALGAALEAYTSAVFCHLREAAPAAYGGYPRPQGGEDTTFKKMLARALAR